MVSKVDSVKSNGQGLRPGQGGLNCVHGQDTNNSDSTSCPSVLMGTGEYNTRGTPWNGLAPHPGREE